MALIGWVLLLFLAVLPALATSGGDGNLTLRCQPDQAASLLQLKKSFFFRYPNPLESWQDGTDCCFWEGVACSNSSGHVTSLELSGRGLYSPGLDPAIFNLASLQRLDLSMNSFGQYSLPPSGFERLSLLTHLNLSNSGFRGQIPIGIGRLGSLISLDLSAPHDSVYGDQYSWAYNSLLLEQPNFRILVANLSNLRELYLDFVDMSSSRDWCHTLAKSLPDLRVLSLSYCNLVGPICPSLSTLHALTVINLEANFDTSTSRFPGFFMDFLNLSVLNLAYTNLQGLFPRRTFQSKTLRILDLSLNQDLSGHVPNFSNANSLEIVMLDGTDLSFAKPGPFSNFKSVKTLSLDVDFIPVEPQPSLGILRSLQHLELSQSPKDPTRELGPIFSWIGNLQNLVSLELSANEGIFSQTSSCSIGQLKSVRSLSIGCNFTRPVLFGNLVGLTSLEIAGCSFNGPIPSAIGNLTNLKSLNIEACDFLGPIPSSLGNLVNLRSLRITDIYRDIGPIPSAIGNLTKLKSLNIEYCEFLGPIPSSIGNLMNLRSLEINDVNTDFGPLPSTVGNLSKLESLEIDDSEFSGPIPYEVGLLKKLTSLRIRSCSFSGSIPNSISNLTRLSVLDLPSNLIKGEFPTSIFTIPTLQSLDIQSNQLSSSIQDFNVTSSHLVYVDLSTNQLTGNIPKSFFQLKSLAYLDIGWNNFVGLVNLSSFWMLRNLAYLSLSNNNLSVMDMDGEGNKYASTFLPRVTNLGLVSCNLMGFPSSLAHLNQMSYLDLSCNRISGAIPNWIWATWNSSLVYLNLSHNMLSILELNSYVLPFIRLQTLDLSSNQLQGQIPMPSPPAAFLDYSNNSFSSVLPNFPLYLSSTEYLSMAHNNISGHLPNSVCNSTLGVLDLSYSNFNGLIPSCPIENAGLIVLNLRENHFQGTFPSNITDICALQTIDFHGNKIEGQLPRALYKCTDLEVLDIGNNQVVDTFPSWLWRLPNLRVLVLRSNHFYGSIGDQFVGDHQSRKSFSRLQIIDLASNNFSGNLSSDWFRRLKSMMAKFSSTGDIVLAHNVSGFYQDSVVITYKGSFVTFERILTTLTAIDFSNNRLEGSIPESAGQLVSLRVLNMSHNAFMGKIPAQLGGMADLESLDLSCNQLLGEIPQELTDLTFLTTLNMSNNQLVGKIPQSRQFFTFDNSSFEGNLGLCGLPLSNPCGVSPAPPGAAHVKSSHVDVILFLFVGLGFGIGFAAAIVVRWGRIGDWLVKCARTLRN